MAKPRTSQSFAAQVSCLVASKRMERLAGIASFVCQRFDPRQQRAWATGNLWKQTRNNPQGEALWLPFQDPFCLASVAAPFRNKWHQMFGGITCKKRNHYLSWRYQLSPLGSPQQQGSAFGPGHDLAFLFGCHQYRHQNPSYFSSLKAEPWNHTSPRLLFWWPPPLGQALQVILIVRNHPHLRWQVDWAQLLPPSTSSSLPHSHGRLGCI